MNVNLVAVSLSEKAKREFHTRFSAAIDYSREIFGESNGSVDLGENYGIYNAGSVDGTWVVPTWYGGAQTISVSQPPIPVNEAVSADEYENTLRQIVSQQKFEEFLPNHFGIVKQSDEEIVVWNDTMGIGRCYYIQSDDFFAACNHIGTLAHFLEGSLALDETAVGKFAGAGYFMDDDSPYLGIRRMGASQRIQVSPEREVSQDRYFDISKLVSPTNEHTDYPSIAGELKTIARNLDTLSVQTATVYLSGGRDSRMTAGLWLSGGSDARVTTLGTLEREAQLAQELMSKFSPRDDQSVEHIIRVARSRDITQKLQERVDLAFKMWDGDAAPTNIKRNLTVPTGRSALSIGGVGGEIMHGYYYARSGMLKKVHEADTPLTFAIDSFGTRYLTNEAAAELDASFATQHEESKKLKLDNFSALDYLYMNQKLRRWGNQGLTSTAAIMLASPAFVRGCFNLSPEEKVAKDFPVHLVETAIPEWSGVEYYKASPDDSKKLMKRGLATFQSDPDGFKDLISRGRNWTKYLRADKIDDFLNLAEQDSATYSQESWLNRVLWLEALEEHVAMLNRRISSKLRGFDQLSTQSTTLQSRTETKIDSTFLRSLLRVWPFVAGSSDDKDAALLRDNQVRIGQNIYSLSSEKLELLDSEDNPNFLAFHSLRWLDKLLRTGDSIESNRNQWVVLFESWWDRVSSGRSYERIWNPTTLVQRLSALALGGELITRLPISLVETHLGAVRKCLVQNMDAELRQRAVAALVLIYEVIDSKILCDAETQRDIKSALSGVIRDGGGLFAANTKEMYMSKEKWLTFLHAIDPSSEFTQELKLKVNETEFWVQAHQPDGEMVPFGTESVPSQILDSISELRYVRSHALEGQPPADVRFVDPQGLVTGRTGWGETERELTDETFWSVVCGPVRSRQEHQDIGRLSFSSQGINWLIDPFSDDCFGADVHSGVTIDGAKYRTNGSAELVLQRETDLVDDYVFRINTFLPVTWRRHVTFARTANYLVVEDHLRSSNEFAGSVCWIINPDVSVELDGKSAFLKIDGKTVELQISSGQLQELALEQVVNETGTVLAHRLRASVRGKTARLITVISDVVDPNLHKVTRVSLRGNEYAFKLIDQRIQEQIIVTESGAGILPTEISGPDGVVRVAQEIASGDLSQEEVEHQRAVVHKCIRNCKDLIWRADGSAAAREEAISVLKSVADSERVSGIRDHGLAAALIDIAGADLKPLIKDLAIVQNYNRTAIVDWNGMNQLQEFYQVPIYTSRATTCIPDFSEDQQIWSVDFGEAVLASYNVASPGDSLVVYFHGATDRTRHATPRFERLRSFSTIGEGPLMFFADPTLDFDARMILSWYIGNENIDVHRRIAEMISSYAQQQQVKHVVLVGNSGGGFTALQVSSYLAGVEVLSVNGQIDLGNYQPRIVDPAYRATYGEPVDMTTVSLNPRFNVVQQLRERGFNNRVLMYQNTGDAHHMEDHYQVFEDAFRTVGEDESRFIAKKIFLGDGHVAPSADSYIEIIRDVIGNARATGETFQGLASNI